MIFVRAVLRLGGIFDFDNQLDHLNQIRQEFEDPDIWSDQKKAEALGRERARLEGVLLPLEEVSRGVEDAAGLLELALEESDADTQKEIAADLGRMSAVVEKLEFQRMFNGKTDAANAFVDIQSGAGGTEAQDWAEMLLRMYLRWCERLQCTVGPDRHEGRRLDRAMRRLHPAGPRAVARPFELETKASRRSGWARSSSILFVRRFIHRPQRSGHDSPRRGGLPSVSGASADGEPKRGVLRRAARIGPDAASHEFRGSPDRAHARPRPPPLRRTRSPPCSDSTALSSRIDGHR